MKHKILSMFLLTAILLSVAMISADVITHIETFDNSEATGTYDDGSFLGNDDITWTYEDSKEVAAGYEISGLGLQFQDTSSKIVSEQLSEGIGSFSIKLNPATAETGLRQVELFINGVSQGTSTEFTAETTFEVNDINMEGDVIIRIDNIKNTKVAIDDISWTEYSPDAEEEFFCNNGDGAIGDQELKISKVKITNRGPSEDGEDNKWFPLDTIEVEVELENNGDEEIEDIIFEFGLFEQGSSTNLAEDMLWISEDDEEIEIGDIEEKGEDDELKHTFEFRVNPEDLDKGNYIFKIKAYSDDLDEDNVCVDYSDDLSDNDFGDSIYYAEIDINKEKENDERPVVVDVEELNNLEAFCDTEVSLVVDIWNIGDEDQEQVKVTLFNEDLGIDMDYVLRGGLDEGDDKEEIEFVFKIPKDAEEKEYLLDFQTYYDYDEDDDTFDERSKIFRTSLKVEGNCAFETSEPQITAELDPETPDAIAGEQVIIKTTIRNTGNETITYIISVSGNSAWSSLNAIDSKEITLEAGESEDVDIILDLDDDAQGDKEFTIRTTYGDETAEQKIALFVENPTAAGITGATVGEHIRTNWFIYIIALINIILIIAIIAVIKSMAGKAPASR